MILQCDQCQTKFRLDDSKLKPGGVKVRCSKCRHVFLAGAEQKQEESEFDALLSGLGGPAPDKPAGPAPAKDAAALFGFDEESAAAAKAPEPAPQPQTAVPQPQTAVPQPQTAVPQPQTAVPQPEPAASQPDFSDLDSFEFPADAFPTQEQGVPAEEKLLAFGEEGKGEAAPATQGLEFAEFAFPDESALEQAGQPEGGTGLDFGELSFDEVEKRAADASAAMQGEDATAADAGAFDFGEFDFDASPAAATEQPQPAAEALDFGEFAFNEEPAPASAPERAQPSDAMDFGEISFNEEPTSPSAAVPAQPASDDFGFGELSFDEEPVPAAAPEQAPPTPDALDFGEFSFEEPAATAAPEQAPPTPVALDFGEFSFEEPVAAAAPEQAPGSDAFDFSEFSFDEEPATAGGAEPAAGGFGASALEPSITAGEPAPGGIDALDFGEFSFAEEPPAVKEEPAPADAEEFDFGDFTFGEEPPPVAEEPAAADDFGSFSFGEEPLQKPVDRVLQEPVAAAGGMPGASAEKAVDAEFAPGLTGAALAGGAAGLAAQAGASAPVAGEPSVSAAASAGKPAEKEPSSLDFSFGNLPEEFGEDDELPPLGITSRRKGRSAFTVAILVLSVLVILALSAAGIYVMKSGPDAMKKLDQYGIGFVADWFGVQSPDEGRITIRNPVAAFHQNKEAGELFVVTGEAVNTFKQARASVQVKVNIYDKNGAVLVQKTAYCGNRLTNEQLATLPMEKIESIMNNQFGDSLSNLGIKPGQAIGFVVALANVPKEAADFGVEVVGSTVAGQ
jgi:predicted Zn finger-like uncharacterized protein